MPVKPHSAKPANSIHESTDSFSVGRWLLQRFVRTLARSVMGLFYRMQVHGQENIPAEGATLLVGNHVSYLDAFLIGSATGQRWVRFLVYDGFMQSPWLAKLLDLAEAVPVSSTRAKEALKVGTQTLKRGDLVALFPEGQITRHGQLNEIKKGFELMARGSGASVVPFWLDHVWGSIFSFQGGKYFTKRPHELPYHLSVWIGEPIPAKEATSQRIEAELRLLSAQAISARPATHGTVAQELRAALRRQPSRQCLRLSDGSWLSRGAFLAEALGIAEKWQSWPKGSRIGLVGSSAEVVLAAAALILSDRVPVFLPEGTIYPAPNDRLATIITTEMVQAARESLSPIKRAWRRFWAWLPVDWCHQRVASDGIAIATPLGELSHREVLRIMQQLYGTDLHRDQGQVIVSAPLDSASGMLFGFCWALLSGQALQIESPHSGEIVFLNPDNTRRHSLRSGENLLVSETPPSIIALSQPDPPVTTATASPQPATKPGTYGRLLPGLNPIPAGLEVDAEGFVLY